MIALNLDRVSVTYATEPVFEDLAWEIHDNRCVGLVGPNGCGKSTLLRLIAGEVTSDTGFTTRRQGISIGYLQQEPHLEPGRSVWQETLAASTGLARVEAGAQGPHKLARGYEPVTTRSLHWLPDPGFRRAVADYLERERDSVAYENRAMMEMMPFKKGG